MSEVSIKCNPKLAAAVNECIELIGELDKDKALEFCALLRGVRRQNVRNNP